MSADVLPIIEGGQTYEPAGRMDIPERVYACVRCGSVVTWPSIPLHSAWHKGDR